MMPKSVDRLHPNELARLTVLAGIPDFEPGRNAAAALRKALAGDGLVDGSIAGVADLLEAGTDFRPLEWRQYAQNEGIVLADWDGPTDLLIRLGRAAEVRTVVGVHHSLVRLPDWQWPLRIGFLPGNEAFVKRVRRQTGWLDENLDIVVLGSEGAECDVAVAVGANAIDAYERSVGVRAEMLLVLGPINPQAAGRASDAAKAVDASGSATVMGRSSDRASFLRELVVELSHARELPEAIHRAATTTNHHALLEASADLIDASNLKRQLPTLARRARRGAAARSTVDVHYSVARSIGVTAGQPMSAREYTARMAEAADGLAFDSEGGTGAAIGVASRAVERAAPKRPQPRFLQAQVFVENSPQVRAPVFLAGRHHIVAVRVGSASTDWMASREKFPDTRLFRGGVKTAELDVALVIAKLGVAVTDRIKLDRTGDSDVVELPFDIPVGVKQVLATIAVSHGGTVLQVAEVRGPCLRREPPGDATRILFDLKAVTSDGSLERLPETLAETTATVVVGDDVAVVSGPPGAVQIKTAVSDELAPLGGAVATTLRDQADPFAAATKRGSPLTQSSGIAALRTIALAGSDLLAAMENAAVDTAPLRAADRIRVVLTNESPVLPLELVYDGPVGNRAKPCAESVANCRCKGPAKSGVICLRRFWGLSKLIERHAPIDAGAGSGRSSSDPKKPLAKLAPFTSALFGVTTKVPEDQRQLMSTKLSGLVGSLHDASSWSAWRKKAPRRSLLIGVVHNEVVSAPFTALEIGTGDFLRLGQVDQAIVGRGRRTTGPIVMLIGCRTALPDNPLVSFVSRLRANGAAVVVGSLADIPVLRVETLVSAVLRTVSEQIENTGSTTVASALKAARATLLSEGHILGMALVAYGDAHWLLTKETG
jgi:hypothetical protein